MMNIIRSPVEVHRVTSRNTLTLSIDASEIEPQIICKQTLNTGRATTPKDNWWCSMNWKSPGSHDFAGWVMTTRGCYSAYGNKVCRGASAVRPKGYITLALENELRCANDNWCTVQLVSDCKSCCLSELPVIVVAVRSDRSDLASSRSIKFKNLTHDFCKIVDLI